MHVHARLAAPLVTLSFLFSSALHEAMAADESLVVTVKVFPAQGREDELQARYRKQIEFLRKAEPSSTFRLHRSAKEPTTFLWYETYESQAALENHLKVVMPAFRKEHGPTPEGLIARPSESDTYRELEK